MKNFKEFMLRMARVEDEKNWSQKKCEMAGREGRKKGEKKGECRTNGMKIISICSEP